MANLKDAGRRLLWGRSGGMCAYPGCGDPLIEPIDGKTRPNGDPVEMAVGEEAHIVAEQDDGPRGDPSMPVSERNSYPNMILFCYKHHKFVDRDNGLYFTVQELHEMKAAHERMVRRRLFESLDPQAATARRDDALAELSVTSRARLIARWAAAGLDDARSCELADDPSIGDPKALAAIPEAGLVVLAGEFGSGKSVTAERLHQDDIAAATKNPDARLPMYLTARSVQASLMDAVASAASALGDPARTGVRLVLDGLDEAGAARAAELIDEARVIVKQWPGSRVLATARPGLELRSEEALAYPPMTSEEADALARRIGGHWATAHAASEAVRDALRLPLFVIIATLARGEGRDVPRSPADFLDILVARALGRPGVSLDEAHEVLARLARLTISGGGPSPAGELGTETQVRMAVSTRLVARRGRTLAFGLPVLEQYFAGKNLLAEGLPDEVLESPAELERWRYPLALALAGCGWQRSTLLLDPIIARYPGIASWIVQEAVPSGGRGSTSPLPSETECAQRVRRALAGWLESLAPASRLLELTDDDGAVGPVSAKRDGPALLTVLADSAEVDWTAGPGAAKRPPMMTGHPAADYPSWPWRWSLDWVKRRLEPLLRRRLLDLGPDGPAAVERRWALCRAMTNQSSQLVPPIDPVAVLAIARRHTAAENLVCATFHASRAVRATAAELRSLIDDLEAGRGLDENGMIPWPYPAPVPPPFVRWALDLYDDDALTRLVADIHRNALTIYEMLVERYFPALRPMLGLACMLPVRLTGTVSRGAPDRLHPADSPGQALSVRMSPLPPGSASIVAFDYVAEEPRDVDFAAFRQLRADAAEQVRVWRPGSRPWANSRIADAALRVPGESPATDLAYTWLWEDLKALRIVSSATPSEWWS